MKKYKLVYASGEIKIVYAKNTLELVKTYNLATRENSKVKAEEIE